MFHSTRIVLIWVITAAVPLQGMPTQSCGCTAAQEAPKTSTCNHGHVERAASCCSTHCAGHGCCSTKHRQIKTCSCCTKGRCDCQHCTCGIDCPCRQGQQSPPAAPPAEQRSLDKVLCPGLASNSAVVNLPPARPLRLSVTLSPFDSSSGLERCISLCRLTL